MRLIRRDCPMVELQMGPLIDMVFLLLVFFMVTAKPIRQESDIGLSLPGTAVQEAPVELPDEQRLAIAADGQVALNEMPVDTPASRDLPTLVEILGRFKATATANRAEALVTIDAANDANQQRIVDVLNACAKARISGVTFAADADADGGENSW